MKNLIKGQSLRIDNHDSGSGKEAKWDERVHIHKVMNADNFNGAEILIPLNRHEDITFRKIQGKKIQIEKQLRNEIEKAFKDKNKRREFVKYISDKIENYSRNGSRSQLINNLIEGAESLARHFGLRSKILDETTSNIGDKIRSFTTLHQDENGDEFYIIQDIDGKNIRIGSDLDILNNWDEVKRIFNKK